MKRSMRKSKSRRGGFQPGYIPPLAEDLISKGKKVGKVASKYGKMAGRLIMGKLKGMVPQGTVSNVVSAAKVAKKILPGAVRKMTGKGRRFKKGSPEAKAFMAKLRSMRK